MLLGEYNYAVDEKGRMNFPAKFRADMGESFIVTQWLDECLIAFPPEQWERVTERLEQTGMVKTRDLRRFLFSAASETVQDKQGRILLPGNLREHAGIGKDVTIIGVGHYAEIWDTAAWKKRQAYLRSGPVAAAMEELDF